MHVELDSHDILLAEGAPSESFVDDGSRRVFQNAAEFHQLYPGALRGPGRYCLPRVEDGAPLEAAWLRLSGGTDFATGGLRGFVDGARPDLVHGWARDSDAPGRRVQVIMRTGGVTRSVILGIAVADLWRPDVAAAREGDGWHGFEFRPPGALTAEALASIEVVVATCRTVLPWAQAPGAVPSPGERKIKHPEHKTPRRV